ASVRDPRDTGVYRSPPALARRRRPPRLRTLPCSPPQWFLLQCDQEARSRRTWALSIAKRSQLASVRSACCERGVAVQFPITCTGFGACAAQCWKKLRHASTGETSLCSRGLGLLMSRAFRERSAGNRTNTKVSCGVPCDRLEGRRGFSAPQSDSSYRP